jgi:MinD-like ATPase involved in chromosome partitioning or flagellar assembly
VRDPEATTVLTALGATAGPLVDELERARLDVVRRCPDLEELLASAATGVAEAAVVCAHLPGLDRDALARLQALGVAVVGVAPAGDEAAERRLRQLGVVHVHAGDAAGPLAELVRRAVAVPGQAVPRGFGNPFAALPVPVPADAVADAEGGCGRVVAVWGPTGAPGRTTVAAGLAGELSLLGWPTLLVDADVYGGSLAPVLGLREESSGLASACRAANRGALDVAALTELAVPVTSSLSVLTGLSAADRWPELRPSAVEVVLGLARRRAAVTVVDCGFSLEQDEELSYDTLAPRRNGATLAVLAEADLVVAVGSGDQLGVRRLVRGLAELQACVPGVRTSVVVNRVRDGADAAGRVRGTLRQLAGVDRVTCLPHDVAAADAALDAGRLLHEAAPAAALRLAVAAYAASLVRPAARPRSRRLVLHR